MNVEKYVKLYVNAQGMELKAHGTPLFPVAFYYDDLTVDEVPWHWHDELEVIYAAEGESVVTAGAERFPLRQGQGLFINSGVLHACHLEGDGGCLYHSIVFHPRLISGGIDTVYWQRYVKPLVGSRGLRCALFDRTEPWHADMIDRIERAWLQGAYRDEGYEFQVRALLSELAFALFQRLPDDAARVSVKGQRDGERIKRMLQFIQDNFAENITVNQIAASAAVSVSECLRCFNSTIGEPPIQYLKQYRVQRAAELLTGTDRRVGDIAAQCGFQDVSYFTKTFRTQKGMTPGEYRRVKSGE